LNVSLIFVSWYFRIREYVRKYGSRSYKRRELDKRLFEQFLKWKQHKQVVKDRDLFDAAFFIADSLHLDDFKVNTFNNN
jgi:cation diffusion facilitator CzcD-associated flavoprotein CzcO